MDTAEGKDRYAHSHMENDRGSKSWNMDTFTESHTLPAWPISDNIINFLSTWNGGRIRMVSNLNSMIIDLRQSIYNKLGIPTCHWRLSSCGGIFFSDTRTLAYYDIRDRDTVVMRLLLRGGAPGSGGQSRKPMAPWDASNKTRHSEQLKRTTVAMPRRSERLSLNRRKKENKESLGCDIESCMTQANEPNSAIFLKKLAILVIPR